MQFITRLVAWIDAINGLAGRLCAWLALIMVLIQFYVVILRYIFAIGFVPMQEAIWYSHGLIFMLGAGFTLMHDGHVRVDIFYREASDRTKAFVNLFGTLLLLLPVCVLTYYLSHSYVVNAWKIFEGSTENSGLPAIFLLKTAVWAFAILLGLQGLALAGRAVLTLKPPGPG